MTTKKPESLEELCIRSAIDNLDMLGDVGHTDFALLRTILPHCTAEQLLRIETATTGRDLSPITNELWLKCYTRKFGPENVKLVTDRMKKRNTTFKWKTLYQAKQREQDDVQKKCVNRLRELYVEAESQKQSRKIQLCELNPPVPKRKNMGGGGSSTTAARGFQSGGTTVSTTKGRLMKKARMEYAASAEAKRLAAMTANRRKDIPAKSKFPTKR